MNAWHQSHLVRPANALRQVYPVRAVTGVSYPPWRYALLVLFHLECGHTRLRPVEEEEKHWIECYQCKPFWTTVLDGEVAT